MRRREFLSALVAAPVAAVAALEPDEDKLCGWCLEPLPCPEFSRGVTFVAPEPYCVIPLRPGDYERLWLREQIRATRMLAIPPGLL